MGYLGYAIALIMVALSNTSGLMFNQGVDIFLNNAAKVNGILFWICLGIWVLVLAATLLFGLKPFEIESCGAWAFLLLPVVQFIIWRISIGMANSFGPDGVINPTRFWVLVALTVLLGSG